MCPPEKKLNGAEVVPIIIIRTILLVILIFVFIPVQNVFADMNDGNNLPSTQIKNPDYKIVFSDDMVHEITILIDPSDWQIMQDDLQTNFSKQSQGPQESMTFPYMNMNLSMGFGEMEKGFDMGVGMGMGGFDNDPIYVPATIRYNGTERTNVGIRYKGFSSLTGAVQDNIGKISLKIDIDRFEDEFPDTKNQRLYGFDELNL